MDYSSGLNYLTNLLFFQELSTGYDFGICWDYDESAKEENLIYENYSSNSIEPFLTHSYSETGEKLVKIIGRVSRLAFNTSPYTSDLILVLILLTLYISLLLLQMIDIQL